MTRQSIHLRRDAVRSYGRLVMIDQARVDRVDNSISWFAPLIRKDVGASLM